MHPALRYVSHRPWPLPPGRWVMRQMWRDLLFAHYPVPYEQLRALVPSQLAIDTYEGNCWASVTPFHMSGIHGRFIPPIPRVSALAELSGRTYVTYGGKPGVYFFSL